MASRGNTSNLPDQPNSNKTDNDLVEHIEIGPIKIELDASEDSESNDEMHTPSKMARLEENGSKRRTNKNHNHSYGESFGCSTDSEDTPGTIESDHTESTEGHKHSLGAYKLTPAGESMTFLKGLHANILNDGSIMCVVPAPETNATTSNTTSEQPNNHLREEQPACNNSIISNKIETYSEVKILLKAWKLDNLNDLFETQKITLEVLEMIQDNEINELFQGIEIGYKALFKHKLKLWRQQHIDISRSSFHSTGYVKSVPSTTSTLQYRSSPEVKKKTVTLAEILNSNPESAIIEIYYSKYSKLLCEHRNLLMNIICGYFKENKLHLSLTASYNLEKEIVQRFPQEKIEYYRTGKRGKIYIKYTNSKKKIKNKIR